jgi:RNA polymerase sigma-70 factor (ECF subfamily)
MTSPPTSPIRDTPPPPGPSRSADEERAEEHGWIEAARAGDVDAFEHLYRRHVGRLEALCRRMCGNVSEAEEMVQEAFVRAWERLGSFRGESAFGSWLHRLTVNVVLGSWRAAGRYRERVVAVEDPEEPPPGTLAVDGALFRGYPSTTALALDLERAIAGLPTGARTVFVLHDIEGWPHREIAEHMGTAENTSKTQLHRARRLLRSALGGATD